MDNYINRRDHDGGFSFDAYWVIHGNPLGWNANGKDFHSYIDFHDGKKPAQYGIPWPTQPGEKFIHEEMPGYPGCFAYTFLHTGIYETQGSRPGTNYGAITVIMDDMDESHTKHFEQDLKKWFEENILNKFTYDVGNGRLKWDNSAISLFEGAYDKRLKESLQLLLKPYLSYQNSASNQHSNSASKTNKFNDATKKLQDEIAELEQQQREIAQLLETKRAQLGAMQKGAD